MANLIQATVYQIDGSPLASPITVDFPVNDIIVRKDNTLNIPAVNSAIQLYSSTLNQISYKTYYVSQTVTTLVNLANDTITSFVKVNVLEINGDPVFGGIDYGFPSNQIAVNAAVNPTTGVNATITYRNNTYSVSQTQASILSSSSGYAGVVLNQLDVPSFRSDILANIPAPGQIGRMFVSTDTYALYRDSGVSWDLIGGPGTGTVTGSGSVGQVSFWSGASTIVGNSNLYWDSANNRLGVGTTSPAVRLDVNGDVNLATGYTLSWGGAYGANIPSIAGVSGVGSNIRFYPSGSTTGETMRITSNGNVLVGTTTDAGYRLDVSGNIRSNNGLWVTNTLNPAVGVMTWGAFGGTNIQIGSWSLNTPVYFVLGSSPRMRLGGIAAGDVGQLTVGNVSSSDAAWVSTSYLLALGVSASLENNNEGSTFYSYNAYRSAGGLRYIASNPALSFGLDFNKFVWRSAASGTSGNLITFTESMTLDINGRLGIGTSNPQTQLDIANGLMFGTIDAFPSATYDAAAVIAKTGSLGSAPFNNAGSIVYRARVTSTAGRSSHIFYTGSPSTERMRLDESGRLGIGTTSPGGIGAASLRLDVRGTTWFSADDYGQLEIIPTIGNGGETVIRQYTSSPRNGGDLRIRVDAAIQGGNLIIATGNNTERMRVFANGNVGIGTSTDAGFKFDVNGTARINGVLTFGSTPTLESFGGNQQLKITSALGLTISSDRWNSNTSTSSYIQNGYSNKSFVVTPTQNANLNSFDFSASSAFAPTIAVNYNQKLINGSMTINSTAVANFFGVDSRTTDNSASIANNVYAIYADATLGTNTSAIRWAGYFVGRGYFSDVVGIGTTSPNASAILDLTSTTKGFLPPRMTGAQAEAIGTPAAGLLVYANNGNGATIISTGWWGYDGTTWVKLN